MFKRTTYVKNHTAISMTRTADAKVQKLRDVKKFRIITQPNL
jgi:hypothetical protein